MLGTEEASVSGDGSRMEGPSVSTAVTMTAAAVAVPAVVSSSAAPMSIANHVRFWEGDVALQGKQICIPRLQGFIHPLVPEILLPKFPQKMDIVRLQPMAELNSRCTGDWKWLFFRAKEQHNILLQMRDKHLYAEIKLPSETLLLYVGMEPTLLTGILLHEEREQRQQQLPRSQTTVANSREAKPAATCCVHPTSTGGPEATRTANSWPAPNAPTSSPAPAGATKSPAAIATASSLPTASTIGWDATSSTSGPAATALASELAANAASARGIAGNTASSSAPCGCCAGTAAASMSRNSA